MASLNHTHEFDGKNLTIRSAAPTGRVVAAKTYGVSDVSDGDVRAFELSQHDDGNEPYIVTTGGAGSCTCPAGIHGKPCKHVKALKSLIDDGAL